MARLSHRRWAARTGGGRGRFVATTIDAMTGSTGDNLYVHVHVCDEALARGTRLRL
jgi:hypothetical protein